MATVSTGDTRDELARRRGKKSLARNLRDWHTYLGTFFAPAILFFAFTGALQTFSLHEDHGAYHAPVWIEKLARIHKDQTSILPPKRPPEPKRAAPLEARAQRPGPPEQRGNPLLIQLTKWFVLALAVGLFSTTLLGLYMAFQFSPSKRLNWVLLAAGCILPLGLVLG